MKQLIQVQLTPADFDPIEKSFKWILILGRVIGVVPVSISWKEPQLSIRFRWWSFSAIHSLFLCFVMFLVLFPQILGLPKDLERCKHILDQLIVMEISGFLLTSAFVYAFFLKNGKKLVILMEKWKETMRLLNLPKKDHTFPLFCISILTVILSIGFIENISSDFSMIETQAKEVEGLPEIEKLYLVEVKRFSAWMPYNPILGLIVLYVLRAGTYAWNFGDIFLIVLCRAVSIKFQDINEEIQEYLKISNRCSQVVIEPRPKSTEQNKVNPIPKGIDVVENLSPAKFILEGILTPGSDIHFQREHFHLHLIPAPCGNTDLNKFWQEIRNKVMIMSELTSHVTKFVAPLVLACYGCNIGFIISRILQFLYDSTTIVENSVYIYVSSFQFFIRVLLVTYHASQVYHSTEKIVRTIELSSDSNISDTTCRLERMLERHPVGVTILGAVTITKKFFISIISFMFTTEIILLQAMSTGNARS